MASLQLTPGNKVRSLPTAYKNSILYHDIFDFPLTKDEVSFWQTGKSIKFVKSRHMAFKKGYFHVKGREDSIVKRQIKKKFSESKVKIAKKASLVLAAVPSVKMVGITGSLAMDNAGQDSDIDLMVVASQGTLWATRLICYLFLLLNRFDLRRSGLKTERDKLCLNIWLDEKDLDWNRKNIFTAHEVLQVKPLVNKNNTYERFISENSWAGEFWPNAMAKTKRSTNHKSLFIESLFVAILRLLEPLAFWFEYGYMKNKITHERVTPTKALFHPFDWSKLINSKIKSF